MSENRNDSLLILKFLKGSFSTFLLQISFSLLTFLTSIVVARVSGDKGFGIYSLVFTWVTIFGSVALFGLDDLALKQLSIYKSKDQLSESKSFIIWGLKQIALFSLIFTLTYIFFCLFPFPGIYEYRYYHIIASISIPFYVLIYYLQSVLRAIGFITLSQIAEKLIQPISFILILIFCSIAGILLYDISVISMRVISFVIAAICLVVIVTLKLKYLRNISSVALESKVWRSSMTFFTLSTLLYTINSRIDIIFLGFFSIAPEEIAYYNVALKFSDIALIPFLVITTVSTPVFASLFNEKKLHKLQSFYTLVTRISFFSIVLIISVFIIFGHWFLSWYGKSFQSGYIVLELLCISKLVHVFVGPANYLLSMTGNEKYVTLSLILSVILTIILHIILIPLFGITGAALSTIAGLIFYDILLVYIGLKKTGLFLTIFGKVI